MTTTTSPDVAPPAGAAVVDKWQPGPPPYRVILGPTRVIGPAEVQGAVIQFADGSVDRPKGADVQPPRLHVRVSGDETLTVGHAMGLAAALVEVAIELGRWAGTITD